MSRSVNSSLSGDLLTAANGLLVHNPYVYKGYYYDSDTGYYYLKSRYYDPRIHRFLSADKIDYLDPKSLSSLDLYVYCGDNPVMGYDPSGSIPLLGTIIGGIVGALSGLVQGIISGDKIWEQVLIGAATGALTGLMIDTFGGASLALTAFGLGTISDAITQVVVEGKAISNINFERALALGFVNALLAGTGAQVSGIIAKGGMSTASSAIVQFILGGFAASLGTTYNLIISNYLERKTNSRQCQVENIAIRLLATV